MQKTKTLSLTEQKLIEQLTTNTGTHFLDSGGAYGRNWQRNKDKDFLNEKPTLVEFSMWGGNKPDILISHNVFSFLCNGLEYDQELDGYFVAFASLPENSGRGWMQVAEDWFNNVGIKDIWNNSREPQCINTYNGEDMLSQTLQYWLFEWNNTNYIALQVHGGCDVRGGYTRPYIYQHDPEIDYPSIYSNNSAYISCENDSDHNWQYSGSWGFQGCWGGDCKELNKYEASENIADKGKGKLYINDDRQGFCPLCGGKLDASI
jgi:hypothetical protein